MSDDGSGRPVIRDLDPETAHALALAFARAGRAIVPLWWVRDGKCACPKGDCGRNTGKHPIASPAFAPNGVKDATLNESIIEGWFRRFPNMNWGYVPADGEWVLDLDNPGQFVREVWATTLPSPGVVVESSAGKFHHLLRGEPPVTTRIDGVLDIRKHGGNLYAVGPGSMHLSGQPYRLLTPVEDVASPPAAPVGLAEAIDAKAGAGKDSKGGAGANNGTGPDRCATEWCGASGPFKRDPGGHHQLLSYAGHLRARHRMTEAMVRKALMERVALFDPPYADPTGEVERVIKWDRDNPDRIPVGEDEAILTLPLPDIDAVFAGLSADDSTNWLIDGWLEAGGLTWWAGQPKSMKSLAVLQMLREFVSGGSWMGRPVVADASRVAVYVTREGTRATTRDRVGRIRDGLAVEARSRFRVSYLQPLDFGDASQDLMVRTLTDMSEAYDAALQVLLVLDPMRDFMLPGWDENDAKVMALVKRWCRALLNRFPWLSIIVVHHLRKSAGLDGGSGLDMSGSGAGYAAGDGTVNWWAKRDAVDDDDEEDEDTEDDETLVRLVPRRGGFKVEPRGGAMFKGRWAYAPDSGEFSRQRGVPTTATGRAAQGSLTSRALSALARSGRAGATAESLAVDLGLASSNNLRTPLARALKEGKVERVGDRYYAPGFAPTDEDGTLWTDPVHGV